MGKISLELIRKRAEHNEGEIRTLEELALHQERISKIENLDKWCRELKILLLQNNLITKIENLSRLKRLEYINLAMNNIELIEGLEGCENLKKLDLTLNFIGEISSVVNLRSNHFLDQLYLVGNPCTDFGGYRDYVVSMVPQIMFLDGVEIPRSERIKARQGLAALREKMHGHELKHFVKREEQKKQELPDSEDDESFWTTPSANTPEVRAQIHKKLEADEAKKNESSKPKKEPPKPRKLFSNGGRPYNVNEGKYPFKLEDETDRGIITLDVGVPKHMDTSLIQLDVQPNYIKVLIKNKIFQLVLPEEVKPDDSFAQRSQNTGHLVVTMPKFDQTGIIQFWKGDNKAKIDEMISTKPKSGNQATKKKSNTSGHSRSSSRSPSRSNQPRSTEKAGRDFSRVSEDDVPPLV